VGGEHVCPVFAGEDDRGGEGAYTGTYVVSKARAALGSEAARRYNSLLQQVSFAAS